MKLQELLNNGVNVETAWQDATILHLAVQERQFTCATILLDYGAQVNSRNRSGEIPLDTARKVGASESIIKLLH